LFAEYGTRIQGFYSFDIYSRQNKLPNKKPPHYDAKQDRNAEAAVLSEQHKGEIMKMQ
jgi:hypothetical protein